MIDYATNAIGGIFVTLLMYLSEYTTFEVCHGNHSECARRLGMKYNDLRKIWKRIESGGTSGVLMQAILEMYWREDLSLDCVLKKYTETRLGQNYELEFSACDEIFDSINEVIAERPSDKQSILIILKCVDSLGESIRQNFCEKYCNRTGFPNETCPLRQYASFVQALKREMDYRM